jgi:hypothetical protein
VGFSLKTVQYNPTLGIKVILEEAATPYLEKSRDLV